MTRRRDVLTIGALLAGLWMPGVSAETLSFSFADPTEDVWGCSDAGCGITFPNIGGPVTDAVGLSFRFDSDTGDYEATMSASAERPFIGDVVVNVNLFNANTQTLFKSSHSLQVDIPSTAVAVTGTSAQLLAWKSGDQVAVCHGRGGIIPESCSGGLGSPPTEFQSGVINFSSCSFTQTARDSFQRSPPATIEGSALSVAPPPTGMITSSKYPNFRFWVRFSGSRMGTSVADCLAGTVCVAGSLSARTEVLIRIVGPKPNGYLWPTIVKFNTTKTEVWIKQVTTGVTRYYSFPALALDASELPGYVDKTGFRPSSRRRPEAASSRERRAQKRAMASSQSLTTSDVCDRLPQPTFWRISNKGAYMAWTIQVCRRNAAKMEPPSTAAK